MRKTFVAISLIFASLLPFTASAQMMGWSNGWNMGGFMGIGWIFGLIIWILIIIGAVWLIKCLVGGCGPRYMDRNHTNNNSAIEILKERYAKGEIKKEEFEEKMKDLLK